MNYDDNPINQEFGDFLLSDDWLVVEDELRIPRSISSSHTSDSLDQYIYDTLGGNHQIHSGLTSNNAITTSCSVASHDDPNPNPLCDFSSTDSSGVDEQLWSKKQIQEIQEIIDNPTNPGKPLPASYVHTHCKTNCIVCVCFCVHVYQWASFFVTPIFRQKLLQLLGLCPTL